MPRCLHRVGVEQHAAFMAHRADCLDRLDGADLIVGEHDGHEAGVVTDGVRDLLGRDKAVCVHVQQRHLKALFFQPFQGMQDGMMLKCGGNNVLFALARAEIGGGGNSLIVGLAAAGGKIDFARLRAEAGGHIGTRRLEHFLGLLADGVEARRVAERVIQVIGHRIDGRLVHSGGCCVIRIDLHQISAPLQGILSYVLRIAYIPHKVNRFIG